MLKSYGLTGRSDNKVDAKGRINIPSQMRRILAPNTNDEVAISLGSEGHLSVFNKDYWVNTIQQNIMDQAENAKGTEEWNAIQRAIHRMSENTHMSAVDSQGRITIPQWLLEQVEIVKDAKVIGAVDRISIWAPDRYGKWLKQGEENSGVTGIYI